LQQFFTTHNDTSQKRSGEARVTALTSERTMARLMPDATGERRVLL
jgi:hypothetical protein